MRSSRAKRFMAILSLLCALVLVACGGSSGDSGSDATSDSGASEQKTTVSKDIVIEEQQIYEGQGVKLSVKSGELVDGVLQIVFSAEGVDGSYREGYFMGMAVNGIRLPNESMMFQIFDSGDAVEESQPYVCVSEDALNVAGIKSVDTIQVYLSLFDDEGNTILDNEPLDIAVASASGDGTYAVATSDNVMFEGDGITISYQGSGTDTNNMPCEYFLLENESGMPLRMYKEGEVKVNGEVSETGGVTLQCADTPDGMDTLASFSYYDYESGSADYESVEMTVAIGEAGTFKTGIQIPVKLTRSGDELSVEAGEAEYASDWSGTSGKGEESTTTDDSSSSSKAETGDLEVVDQGLYTYDASNSTYPDNGWWTTVVCAVKNPNEDMWCWGFDIVYTLYDKDGKELGSVTSSNKSIEPGGTVPFVKTITSLVGGYEVDFSVEPATVEARIENAQFTENEYTGFHHNDDLKVTDLQIMAPKSPISSPSLAGTLTNAGEEKRSVHMVFVLYDENDKIVFGDEIDVSSVPANGSIEFDEELEALQNGSTDLPAYESSSIDILSQ